MSGRIVVGVDGSDHSRRALRFAVEEARRRGATIDAVHAYHTVIYQPGMEFGYAGPLPPQEKLEAEAMKQLLEVLAEVPADVPVDPIVAGGTPSHVLIEAGEGADVVIVGSRGFGGFKGLLLGSTSLQVVTHAPCPVIVVPPPS